MTRKGTVVVALVMLLITSMGCSLGKGAVPAEAGVNQASMGEAGPVQPAPKTSQAQPTTEGMTIAPTEVSSSFCEAGKWEFIPTRVTEYPLEEEGWKAVEVQLAVRNGSPIWGGYVIEKGTLGKNVVLSTEGGGEYPAIGGLGTVTSLMTADHQRLDGGHETLGNIFLFLPPTFSAQVGSLLFKVAESQSQYTLTLSGVTILCYADPETTYTETKSQPTVLSLQADYPSITFPTATDIPLLEFGQPVELPVGTLVLAGAERRDAGGGDEILLTFQLTNTSQLYTATGCLCGYLIGDDGSMAPYEVSIDRDSLYQVGPGQTGEIEVGYLVNPGVKDLKLVLVDEDNQLGVAFSLPALP